MSYCSGPPGKANRFVRPNEGLPGVLMGYNNFSRANQVVSAGSSERNGFKVFNTGPPCDDGGGTLGRTVGKRKWLEDIGHRLVNRMDAVYPTAF